MNKSHHHRRLWPANVQFVFCVGSLCTFGPVWMNGKSAIDWRITFTQAADGLTDDKWIWVSTCGDGENNIYISVSSWIWGSLKMTVSPQWNTRNCSTEGFIFCWLPFLHWFFSLASSVVGNTASALWQIPSELPLFWQSWVRLCAQMIRL